MANIEFGGFVYNSAGAAISGATVDLFDRNTTTPVRATTTTNASGFWTISHATEGRFDVQVTHPTSGTIIRRKYDDRVQLTEIETANLLLRNPANTFKYDIVPAAITADRQLNLPLITATRTLVANDTALADSAALVFGTGADASITYDGTHLKIAPRDVGSGNVHINDDCIVWVGVTGRASDSTFANGYMNSAGIVISQGTNSDEVLAFKSSSIAHGITELAETDTFGAMLKHVTNTGGLEIDGYSESNVGIQARGFVTTVSTTKATTSAGAIQLNASLKSGTSPTAMSANSNLVVIMNNGSTRFICDAEGDLHVDGSSTLTTFDDLPDIDLLTTVRALTLQDESFKLHFADFIERHAQLLHDRGVITLNDDGHHFVSYKGVLGLFMDAFRQVDSRLKRLEALALTEGR